MGSQWQLWKGTQRFPLFLREQGNRNSGDGDSCSGVEPRLLSPAHCPFHCTSLLIFIQNQLPGPLVANPPGDFCSLWTQPLGWTPFHLACLPANLELQAPICRAEISQGLAGHCGVFESCAELLADPLEQGLNSFFTSLFLSWKCSSQLLLMVKQNKAKDPGNHRSSEIYSPWQSKRWQEEKSPLIGLAWNFFLTPKEIVSLIKVKATVEKNF